MERTWVRKIYEFNFLAETKRVIYYLDPVLTQRKELRRRGTTPDLSFLWNHTAARNPKAASFGFAKKKPFTAVSRVSGIKLLSHLGSYWEHPLLLASNFHWVFALFSQTSWQKEKFHCLNFNLWHTSGKENIFLAYVIGGIPGCPWVVQVHYIVPLLPKFINLVFFPRLTLKKKKASKQCNFSSSNQNILIYVSPRGTTQLELPSWSAVNMETYISVCFAELS